MIFSGYNNNYQKIIKNKQKTLIKAIKNNLIKTI